MSLKNFTKYIYGVWGSSKTNIYIVGEYGAINHNDGTGYYSWTTRSSDAQSTLRSIWGSSATDIFIVGDNGTILHRGP